MTSRWRGQFAADGGITKRQQADLLRASALGNDANAKRAMEDGRPEDALWLAAEAKRLRARAREVESRDGWRRMLRRYRAEG